MYSGSRSGQLWHQVQKHARPFGEAPVAVRCECREGACHDCGRGIRLKPAWI
jgi:hypothetical protein